MSVSAKFLRGRIGATVIEGVVRTEVASESDELDATNAESDGFQDTDAGTTGATITFDGIHDIAATGPLPTLLNGATLTNVRVYLQSPDGVTLTGPYWNFPSMVILTFTHRGETRGRIEYTCRVKSKGSYTYVP